MEERTILETHPSMMRNHPITFFASILLLATGIGVASLLFWWVRVRTRTFCVTDRSITYRKGLFRKHAKRVMLHEIREVRIKQGPLQTRFGSGKIMIMTEDSSEPRLSARGIPDPRRVKEIIDGQRGDERQQA